MRCPIESSVAVLLAATSALAQTPDYASLQTTPNLNSVWTWDSNRQRVIAVDGSTSAVWEWDGSRWRARLGATQATAGIARSAGYDPFRGLVIVDGTRSFDGVRWVNHPNVPAQLASAYQVGAFDLLRRRYAMPTPTHMVEWDGGQWHAIPTSNGPGARHGSSFTYDATSQRCVLYGGHVGALPKADCWTWDGVTWTLVHANAAPGPRLDAVLVHDPMQGHVVLYGGGDTATWVLQANTWTSIATSRNPGTRIRPMASFDGGGVLLGGGDAERGGELWRFHNNDWTELSVAAPTPRYFATFGFDAIRNQAVLFGGDVNTSPGGLLDDTWTFDSAWQPRRGAQSPGAQIGASFAWSTSDQSLLFYGSSGQTWNWTGTGWLQRTPATVPPARISGGLQPDPAGGVMLFGGLDVTQSGYLGDQWHWNGTNWTAVAPTLAPSARQPLTAYDPLRNVVVVAGGYALTPTAQDTWEWNGAQWIQRANLPAGIGTGRERLAFDPVTRQVRLEALGTYGWDGTTWTTFSTTAQPPYGSAQCVDLGRGRLLRVTNSPEVLAVLTSTPASAVRYGNGCAIGKAPGLLGLGRPVPGGQFQLAAQTFAPGAAAFLAIGFGQQSLPLGSGCTSLVAGLVATSFFVAPPSGEAAVPVVVPNSPVMRGVVFHAQLAVVDPARSLYAGLTLSAGLTTAIGD